MTPEERLDVLEEQLRLAKTLIVQYGQTIEQLSGGKMVVQVAKPGFEDKVAEIPVNAQAPLYKFVPVEPQKPSRIVLGASGAFPKNGAH